MEVMVLLEATREIRAEDGPLAEERRLWEFYKQGKLRRIHLRGDGPVGAVAVLEVDGPEQVADLLRQLPLVAGGVLKPQVVPLLPFTALETLFDKERPGSGWTPQP